jgi:hypothetical protein
MDIVWILLAAYNLLGIGMATYSVWRYISGWLVRAVSLVWYLLCSSFWYYKIVPLWAFALLALFAQFVGPTLGVLFIRLRMGPRYEAWNYTWEANQLFTRLAGMCRRSHENKELIVNIMTEMSLWWVLMRRNNPHLRPKNRSSDEHAEKAKRALTEITCGDWLRVKSDRLSGT